MPVSISFVAPTPRSFPDELKRRYALTAIWLAVAGAGCVRSSPDLPAPNEGAFLTGSVVARSALTGELEPVEGARVRVRGRSDGVLTAADGRFQLQRLRLGRRRVVVDRRADTGAVDLSAYRSVDVLVDGQSIELARVELSRDATLEGLVLRNTPEGPIPAAGAVVAMAGTPFQSVNSAAGFVMPNLPSGTFDVAAYYPGFAPVVRFGVQIPRGQRITVSDFVLQPTDMVEGGAELEVEVLLDDGSPADGALLELISLIDEDATPFGFNTDSRGFFRGRVEDGLYRATVSLEGTIPVAIPNVAVAGGRVTGLTGIVLARISGDDFDGDGLADAVDPDPDNDACPEPDQEPRDPLVCKANDLDRTTDADDDGLSNAEELSPGVDGWLTDPLDRDTDGDGLDDGLDPCPTAVGTSCVDTTNPVEGMLQVTGLSPTTVSPGALLTVSGTGFGSQPVFRFAGEDVVALALTVTASAARVVVPRDAASGAVTVFADGQEAVVPGTLTIVPRPEVARVQPEMVPAGSLVGIYLRNVAVSDPLTIGFGTDGMLLSPEACSTELRAAAGSEERVVCATVPPQVSVVRVRVGSVTLEYPLVVISGPVITQLIPARVAAGATLRILGNDLAANPEEVRFAGGATADVARVSSIGLSVTVPPNAQTGTVEVVYGPLAVQSPTPLIVESTAVLATEMNPRYLYPGLADVQLLGSNLDDVQSVLLPDGTSATSVRVTPTVVQFDVPTAFQPVAGPLTLRRAAGDVMTMFRAGAIRTSTTFQTPFFVRVTRGAGSRVWEINSSQLFRADLDTGFTALRNDFPAITSGQSEVVEGTDFGLVWNIVREGSGPDRTVFDVFDLVTLTRRRTCSVSGSWTSSLRSVAASSLGNEIYIVRVAPSPALGIEILRVGLSTGACQLFFVEGLTRTHTRLNGAVFLGTELLILSDFALGAVGWALINVDPTDAVPDGRVTRGPIGSTPALSGNSRIAETRPNGDLLILTANAMFLSGPSGNRELFSLRTVSTRPYRRAGARFAVRGASGRCSVIDLVLEREVARVPFRVGGGLSDFCVGSSSGNVFTNAYNLGINGRFFEVFELLPP